MKANLRWLHSQPNNGKAAVLDRSVLRRAAGVSRSGKSRSWHLSANASTVKWGPQSKRVGHDRGIARIAAEAR